MQRWRRSHGIVGVNAPSWLTFEVHRPYFDGSDSPLTAIQARASLVAEHRFAHRDPTALRFGMNMPLSYRRLLIQESRLAAYRVETPDQLDPALASPAWARLADAYRNRADLDPVDRATAAQWLVAICLPLAVLEMVPVDAESQACHDGVIATIQAARASALFQSEGLTDRTAAAYRPLVTDPTSTLCHSQAVAAWGYLLARHAGDDSEAADFARTARLLLDKADGLSEFIATIAGARLDLREVMRAERHREFDEAAALLAAAAERVAALRPANRADELVHLEMCRRLVDRRLEIAVRRGDDEGEAVALAEGIEMDPYDVKIRMQEAQRHQRAGRHEEALDAFLTAARLGPYGTAFALLGAVTSAQEAGHDELARVLAERAFRSAPRSQRTADVLADLCTATGDEPLAAVVRRATVRTNNRHENNWHFQMYGSYFNLSISQSPNLYANLPTHAYDAAVAGVPADITYQRLMPPAFRGNLVRESGLADFAVKHPAELPDPLRTPAWDQLCGWIGTFTGVDPTRQLLTSAVLFRLGFGPLVLDLLPERSAADLTTPEELRLHHWRDVVRYVGSIGGKSVAAPTNSFEIALHPQCPQRLRFIISVFAVVFHARETKSLDEASRWRDRAEADLADLLADESIPQIERTMMESRFYRSVTYVPFMKRDEEKLATEMRRAEELARAITATTPYEDFLRRENLRACLESRSKEALGFGHVELAHTRIEEVIAIDPYEPKSHIEHAESLVRMGRHREAADSYLRAARLGPTSTAMSYGLAGECFVRAGHPDLARDCFIASLRVDPYSISSARGWAATVAGGDGVLAGLGRDYLAGMEEWAAARRAAKSA